MKKVKKYIKKLRMKVLRECKKAKEKYKNANENLELGKVNAAYIGQ